MPDLPIPDRDVNADKPFMQRQGKRLVIHAFGLLAGLAMTLSLPQELTSHARQTALFLCTYAGVLCLVPRDFSLCAERIIPMLAGLGPALAFIFTGAPWQLTPLWVGLAALLCRLIQQRGRLSGETRLLPVILLALVSFGLDLAALSKIAFPFWPAVFGLAAWLGARSLRSLEKYRVLAQNPVLKDKAKRQRIMDYTALIHDLEGKIAETPLDMHPYIGGMADAARAIIDLMVTRPRTCSEGDQVLARYLAPALRLVEERAALLADHAGETTPPAPGHPLAHSRDILERLLKAFKDRLLTMNTDKKLDFQADLAVLDTLLKMDGN